MRLNKHSGSSIFHILIVIFFAILSTSCSPKKLETKNITVIKSDGEKISVSAEIARTYEQRQHGFMNRKHIPDGTGMLFIFENDTILSFWMKNTPTALSIAFISSTGVIRETRDMTPFSLASVESSYSVRYALEVPQGWFKKNNIGPGCTIELP